MSETAAFWADGEYDREYGSDGQGRYAAYVRQGTFEPFGNQGTAAELAEFAWRRATSPVMAPGYVRRHPRILSAQVNRSDWDGSLVAAVDILFGAPAALQGAWHPGHPEWHGWPDEWSFGSDRRMFYEPGNQELARNPYMLASVSLRFTVPPGGLPTPHLHGADVERCRLAIGVLVHELNVIVGPVLARIEGS